MAIIRKRQQLGARQRKIGVPETARAEAPLAPCSQKQPAPLRENLIDLADDFTGMHEAFLDPPQQLFLFVVRHIPPCEVTFPDAPPTHRNSNWEEVTASTKRLQGCE
jgi:hypothetical protein